MKGVNLTSPVAQQFESAHRAATNVIDIFGRLALAVNFLIPDVRDLLDGKAAQSPRPWALDPTRGEDGKDYGASFASNG
jgi:hypothetical protein